MNRANFGNVVTNGMQIVSVGATTASKVFSADKVLSNMSPEQQKAYSKMIADKRIQETEEFYKNKKPLDDSIIDNGLLNNSEQVQNISIRQTTDVTWLEDWYERNLRNKNIVNKAERKSFEEFLSGKKGGKQ